MASWARGAEMGLGPRAGVVEGLSLVSGTIRCIDCWSEERIYNVVMLARWVRGGREHDPWAYLFFTKQIQELLLGAVDHAPPVDQTLLVVCGPGGQLLPYPLLELLDGEHDWYVEQGQGLAEIGRDDLDTGR